MNEVENPVSAGIHTGYQVRPGNRALRRDARPQKAESSFLLQQGEVGHLALLHVETQDPRVETIDPEDDDLLGAGRPLLRSTAKQDAAEEYGEQREACPRPNDAV